MGQEHLRSKVSKQPKVARDYVYRDRQANTLLPRTDKGGKQSFVLQLQLAHYEQASLTNIAMKQGMVSNDAKAGKCPPPPHAPVPTEVSIDMLQRAQHLFGHLRSLSAFPRWFVLCL